MSQLALNTRTGCRHTPHTEKRKAQRCIPDEAIGLALDYGNPYKLRDGTVAYHVTPGVIRNARQDKDRRARNRYNNLCIITRGDTVITAMWRHGSIRKLRQGSL